MKIRFGLFGLCLLVLAVWCSPPALAEPLPALRLTEIYYDTPGVDSEEEWIEIANLSTAVIDLTDVGVGDEEQAGGGEGMARFPADASLAPGEVIVVAQTAVGFRALFGQNPDYEIQDSDTAVADMRGHPLWAGGDLALANDGDEVVLVQGFAIVDAISYEDSTAFFAPGIAAVYRGQSIARVPAACDGDTAADWQPQAFPNPGEITLDGDCATPLRPETAAPLPPIGAIQGDGPIAAGINQLVDFRGVVTGMSSDRNTNNLTFHTLFVQDLPGFEDGDLATSDAIPIFLGLDAPTLAVGDQVRVNGQVTEFFGLTEIDDDAVVLQLEATNVDLPAPVALSLPAGQEARLTYLESLEGMRVRLDEALVVGPTFSGCGFAVVPMAAAGERPFRHTVDQDPGPVLHIQHQTDVTCGDFPHVKTGDAVGGLVGVLTYTFDQYRLIVTELEAVTVTAVALPPLPAAPVVAPGQFSVATFNLENHFDTVDDTGDPAEPKPAAEALAIKQTKLAHTIAETLACPTLLAVQEVENATLLTKLAAEAASGCGFTYDVAHLESVDVRGIDVALLVDPERVSVANVELARACTLLNTGIVDGASNCAAGEWPLYSRPPLAVRLTVDGEPLLAFVVHMKSKRGGATETAPRRLAQAAQLEGLVAAELAARPEAGVLVLGDLNDYDLSPPLQVLTANGHLVNVLQQVPTAQRYSYNFGGVSQLIDGILVSPALAVRLAEVTIQHVNADFPDLWGTDLNQKRPYRSSDHDPSVAIFSGERDAVEATAVPTAVPAADDVETARETAVVESTPEHVGFEWWWLVGSLLGTVILVGVIAGRRRSKR